MNKVQKSLKRKMSEFAFHLGKIDNWSLVVKALHGNPKKYQATPYSHVTHFEDMATKDQGKIVNYHILDSRRKIVYRILQRVLLIWKRKLLSIYQPSCAVGNSKELANWLLGQFVHHMIRVALGGLPNSQNLCYPNHPKKQTRISTKSPQFFLNEGFPKRGRASYFGKISK